LSKENAPEEELFPLEFVANVIIVLGEIITAIGILAYMSFLLTGGRVSYLVLSLIVTVVGAVIWWSGKKIRHKNKIGVIPLALITLATTPFDVSDPVLFILELFAIVALVYIYKTTKM